MTLNTIKKQAQKLIEISYKTNNKTLILNLTNEMKQKINEERKKYV